MNHRPRSRGLNTLGLAIAAVALTATLVVLTRPVGATDGVQTAPTITPGPVPTAADDFDLSTGSCDGTGGAGWRVQTFIVNGSVNVGTLAFDQGPTFDRVGHDRDSSDGSIAAPLWKDGAPGTAYNPAASPPGFIDPVFLQDFDFSDAGWVLTDGTYQIGYVCIDEQSDLRQWWSLSVTVDADATPNPFLVVGGAAAEPEDTTVALAAVPASSAPVGEEVVFTATVTPDDAEGEVEFFVDGASQSTAEVADGAATWTTSALTAGTKSITAEFTPEDPLLFNDSTSSALSYEVTEAGDGEETTTALGADPASEAVTGQLVTLTATLTPAEAAGTVTFAADGVDLGDAVAVTDGVATLLTIPLEAGEFELTAAFSPEDADAFTGSTGTLDYEVVDSNGAATTVALVSDPAGQAPVGDEVTLTATVDPAAAAGKVTFVDDGQMIGEPVTVAEGAASLKTSELAEGTHSVIAAFTPDDTGAYKPSSSSPLELVIGGTPTTTTTTTPTTLPPGSTDGSAVAGSNTSNGGSLPLTGMGLPAVGVGLLLLYFGRVLYLLARPSADSR